MPRLAAPLKDKSIPAKKNTSDDNYYTKEVDIISGASMKEVPNILWLEEIRKEDIPSVGGKGASLGEMASIGLPVPRAFVVTAQAFRRFLVETGIEKKIFASYEKLDVENNEALEKAASGAKSMVLKAKMPAILKDEIRKAYKKMSAEETDRSGPVKRHCRRPSGCQFCRTAGDLPQYQR